MNRYAFVVRGERKGRVVDRVTGADVSDDEETDEEEKKLSTQDKLDLARERVKQAEQECANARDAETAAAAAAARRVDDAARALEARRATLSSLAAEAAKRADLEEHTASAEARRALRATLDVMDAAGAVTSAVKSSAAGAGARKSATRRGEDEASAERSVERSEENTDNPTASSVPDAKTRAADAIRARASSSLSRLRKQRRIKRAGSARRSTSQSVANSTVDGVAAGAELALEPPGHSFFTNSSDESAKDTSLSLSFGDTSSGDGVTGAGALILDTALPKPIFVLSDCTGESAANTCRAALTQFAEVMNLSAPTNLYVFRFLSEGSDAYKIVEQASEDDALVVYTLSDASLATAVATACKVFGVKSVNLWGPLLVAMEEHLAMQRTGVPMSSDAAEVGSVSNRVSKKSTRKVPSHGDADVLSTDYYRMIEAVEFTRQMDDGARPDKWRDADILILGVSRTGKTPLSIYLGQRGYKVANLPLVPRDG